MSIHSSLNETLHNLFTDGTPNKNQDYAFHMGNKFKKSEDQDFLKQNFAEKIKKLFVNTKILLYSKPIHSLN